MQWPSREFSCVEHLRRGSTRFADSELSSTRILFTKDGESSPLSAEQLRALEATMGRLKLGFDDHE
jgi:hypothetical protein